MRNPELPNILKEIESLARQAFDAGYREGRKDTLEVVMNAARMPPLPPRHAVKKAAATPGYRPGTVIAQVHELVKDSPGLSGSEIVGEMRAQHGDDIEERTVRTSLRRLKEKWGGLIENREGRWYPLPDLA